MGGNWHDLDVAGQSRGTIVLLQAVNDLSVLVCVASKDLKRNDWVLNIKYYNV